ncbi:hypothetical protein D7W81_40845, partial [Corallococcus aberystwythensis]
AGRGSGAGDCASAIPEVTSPPTTTSIPRVRMRLTNPSGPSRLQGSSVGARGRGVNAMPHRPGVRLFSRRFQSWGARRALASRRRADRLRAMFTTMKVKPSA